MAGLAALMTRKKRDRRRELELKEKMQGESFEGLTTKEAAAMAAKKAANESLKKLILGQELQKQQRLKNQQQQLQQHEDNQNQDAVSQMSNENEDGAFGSSGNAYNAIYLGLVLICVGVVITFVGLGEKGFKTVELKMIGPILCIIGLTCITVKIIHCSFPQMFQIPACLKKAKLRDSDQSNLMEKGVQNGHFGKKATSSKVLSPRVKLQSSRKSRPTDRSPSAIPNYVGHDESSDDDDFDPGRSRPHSNRYYNNAFEESPQLTRLPQNSNATGAALPSSTTPVTVLNPSTQQQTHLHRHPHPQGRLQSQSPPQSELLLSPQGLIL